MIGDRFQKSQMTYLKATTANLAVVSLALAACAPISPHGAGPLPSAAGGPANGALVIAGGGDLAGTGIVERFLELAGGPDAPIVVIPTAVGAREYPADWSGLDVLRAAGASNITILHAHDTGEADSEEFVAPLREAKAVWFPGGRQWRLAAAYLDTRTEVELNRLLERGGVIGGSSAGASIQASLLVRGAPEGNHIVFSPEYDRGFGFLRNAAIDQHLLVRKRENDLLEIVDSRPDLLGIGIDESTAIVVRGDLFEVIGKSRVAVYDRSERGAGVGYHFLEPGTQYDMISGATRIPAPLVGTLD